MNKIEIHYCAKCRWMLRSTWMAQELLSTFDGEIDALTLLPGSSGVFKITANGVEVWCRKKKGRFPEITELKQGVRDVIAPLRDLGCIDRKTAKGEEV